MTRQRIPFLLAAIAGLLAMSQNAHATACPMGVLCDAVSVNLQTFQREDGRWQYDYTARDLHRPYDPEGSEIPVSIPYTFVELRLPYFDEAGITDLRVGSQYAGQLTVSISEDDLGNAGKSIVVSAGEQAILTISPTPVVSGVNSLLSFVAAQAPLPAISATLTLVNTSNAMGPPDEVVFMTPDLDPQHYSPWLGGTVSGPVPEAGSVAMVLAGLACFTLVRRGHRFTR